MIAKGHWPCSVLALGLLAAPGVALAGPNATITNGTVQLRQSYPTFAASTLWKFELSTGPVLTTIPKNTRVEVSGRRIVASTQEWFEVTYTTGTSAFKGWVYGGEVGARKYIALDKGVEERLPVVGDRHGPARLPAWAGDALSALLPDAYAQTSEAVIPPSARTNPFTTLLLGLAYVVIFLGALFITKRWIFKTSNTYSFLTALCVLLILGFLSQTTFADIVAKVLTSG